jgi:hypothetical protein
MQPGAGLLGRLFLSFALPPFDARLSQGESRLGRRRQYQSYMVRQVASGLQAAIWSSAGAKGRAY